jgi:hypothetical protein
MGERACLIAWMCLMVANTVLIGLSVELLVFAIILSFGQITLIDNGTLPFLALGLIAALNFPIVVKLHELGVSHLHFETHENMLKDTPESWETLILTLLDEGASQTRQLEKFVEAIDNAASPAERQERRTEAKAWLMENQGKLTEEDKAFVDEYLGYLKIR